MANPAQMAGTMFKFARSVSIDSADTDASLHLSGDPAYASEGSKLAYASEGSTLAYASEGCNLAYASEGCNLAYASEGYDLAYASEGRNLGYASEGCNLAYASEGYDLAYASEGCNLGYASEGCNLAYPSQGSIMYASGASNDSLLSSRTYMGIVCGDSGMDMYLENECSCADAGEPLKQIGASQMQESTLGFSTKSLLARLLGSKALAQIGSQPDKYIQEVNEYDIPAMYRIGSTVMDSVHRGMQILFATRVKDGLKVVIKTRLKHRSFKSPTDEKDWRHSTECQLNMPKVKTMCQFLEVLETSRYYYVVMERVNGQDLCEHMADERLSHLDAREVVRQVLLALKEMHGHGRIHRDLKLENVMVDLNSRLGKAKVALAEEAGEAMMSAAEVKLIDFDTVTDWEPSKPKEKEIQGTDGYIAPEAYDGEYSPASDMYAVGVIMYKILTGQWTVERESFDDEPGEKLCW